MQRLIPILAAAILAFTDQAHAHAHLRSSTPANHSTLSSAPTTVTLEFHEAVQLTALSLQKSDGAPHKIAPLPGAASKTFTLPLPAIDGEKVAAAQLAASAILNRAPPPHVVLRIPCG